VVKSYPGPDRHQVAALADAALRHASWIELSADDPAAAVAELRELAAGRTDLLAAAAKLFLSEPDEPYTKRAAQLCLAAAADPGRPG
jgi:hypothetical protein